MTAQPRKPAKATQTVWVERWFALTALVCALSFLGAARWPAALHPIMALDNLVFTLVLLRVWFPQSDIARIQERRLELRRKALRWLGDDRRARPGFDEDRG